MGYGWNQKTAQQIFDPGGFFANTPQQPGVGGAAPTGRQLQQDPTTGLYFDPQTGTSYADATGTSPVTDPNVAQQVATNFARAQSYLTAQQGVQGQQNQLGNQLRDVIAGHAPSVAAMQSQQGADTIAAQQMSQAAGVGGASGPLAQLLAMRNTAAGQVGANQTGTIARVAEQGQARTALQNLLSGESQTDAALGAGLTGQSMTGQEAQQGLNASTDAQNSQKNQKLGASLISAFA